MNRACLLSLAAKSAAPTLAGIKNASIHLGCDHDAETCSEVANLLGGNFDQTLHISDDAPPFVIFSASAMVNGVEVRAQGRRDACPGDEALNCHADYHGGRRGTTEEAIAAINSLNEKAA